MWVAAAVWLLSAVAAALVIGRSIHHADRRDALERTPRPGADAASAVTPLPGSRARFRVVPAREVPPQRAVPSPDARSVVSGDWL